MLVLLESGSEGVFERGSDCGSDHGSVWLLMGLEARMFKRVQTASFWDGDRLSDSRCRGLGADFLLRRENVGVVSRSPGSILSVPVLASW